MRIISSVDRETIHHNSGKMIARKVNFIIINRTMVVYYSIYNQHNMSSNKVAEKIVVYGAKLERVRNSTNLGWEAIQSALHVVRLTNCIETVWIASDKVSKHENNLDVSKHIKRS
eukprot:gb/GECG01009915.1/.p1 GENE.gb/GECG01009915.1/~~gb/GECG01009915.1/.p1  ORF type:complete len:115 (+),score=7.33 gb/GECG01009915.1/:1-345(+)